MRTPAIGLAGLMLASPLHAAVFAHYSFDNDFTDSSGNDRHGTLVDNDTAGNTSIIGSSVFGAGAVDFSSDRDYIDVPLSTFGSGSAYTIAFWARKTAGDTSEAAQWDMVIGDRTSTNFFIGLNDVDGTGARWRSSNSSTARQQDYAVAKDYDWHHYAIVASGTDLSLYYDGALFQTDGGKMAGFQFNTIGEAYTDVADFDFHGQMDEVWVFDEALDETAISNLTAFNTIVPEPSTALLSAVAIFGLAGRRRRDTKGA